MENENDGMMVTGALADLIQRGEYTVCWQQHQRLTATVHDSEVVLTLYSNARGEAEDAWHISLDDLRALVEIAELSK